MAPIDLNADGHLDLIVGYILEPAEDRAVPFRALIGDGRGGMMDATVTVFSAGIPSGVVPRQALVADFNGDHRSDVFVADHGYDLPTFPGFRNTLILSNGATGMVNATATLQTIPDYSHSATYGDIDADGDLDIFVGNMWNGAAFGGRLPPYFLINDGHGAFTRSDDRIPSPYLNPTYAHFTTSALFDADGDGDLDLFLGTEDKASTADPNSQVLRNDGQGVFSQAWPSIPPVGRADQPDNMVDSTAVDVNGDGRIDIVANYATNFYTEGGRVQILINRGGGVFLDETALRIADFRTSNTFWTYRVNMVDVNGDGFVDMLMSQGDQTPIYLNDGSGRFFELPIQLFNSVFHKAFPGDFNGDGRLDFASGGFLFQGQEFIYIYLGQDGGLSQVGDDQANGLMGDGDSETLSGLAGDDVIFGAGGSDSVTAGAGNDTIVGGDGERDYLRGDEGGDLILGGAGFDDLNGNMGNDTGSGGLGDDWVVGGKDNDSLAGDQGADLVYGNLGNDTLSGGDGDDIVRGGQQDDVLDGGGGNDFLAGDRDADTISGGAGADTFHTHGEAGLDRVLDFNAAEGDRVLLLPGTQYVLSQVGADTVISMTGGGQIVLVGVAMGSLPDGWIVGA
jgi:Ca2+-binding RTX toxin-like protein